MSANSDKFILILGGNGFIGAECVDHLLDSYGDEYKLILVNRGNWDDWDTRARIKPRIYENIIFDRCQDDENTLRSSLTKYISRTDLQFEAIIDFSGFKAKEIKKICQVIPPDKIKLYIYISTDSVYEASIPKIFTGDDLELKETDSIRPSSKEEIKRLKKLDSYAHHKFKCEEFLQKFSQNKFPYVFLRLPDVIGERDSSSRFWQLQMQLEYLEYIKPNQIHRILISRPFFNLKTSYVAVKDVARAVAYFLKSNIKNEIFNIGFNKSFTLIEFYKLLASCIKPGLEDRLEFEATDETIFHPFPSVTKGPVSIKKLKDAIGFEPSSIDQVIKECVEFYRISSKAYPKMRRLVEKEVKKDLNIKTSEQKEGFDKFLNFYQN